MKSAVFMGTKQVELVDIERPKIEKPTDALIKIVRACVCGSDLWRYRGIFEAKSGEPTSGHEAIGIIEEVGEDVKNFKAGDFVIVPFTHGCGHCVPCLAGFENSCENADDAHGTFQAEFYRAINADGALVKIPGQPSDYTEEQLASLTTLSDVMPTGFHAAKQAGVKAGDTVVVFGDGAVGLCAVIGAKLLGAKRIIAMSRHEDRAALAREFGATDIVAERGEAAVKKLMEMTNGSGADAVLECVGMKDSVETAFQVARAGANVSRVGLPNDVDYNKYLDKMFRKNIGLVGGIASVKRWDEEILLEKVLSGEINPGRVFTAAYSLDEIQQAYVDMDERKTIKSLIKVSD
ncbi:zinc-dependent alcohol dehydrogenase family protein [Lactococcus termiticola]|uniref:Alcohol dehydrogenase n=1 Tax=Lactococcus termiticola TaxID=2169526 RepID=A0A2R5HEC4_9LACT|nr:zinc-dependent alcohol dehydrogenase family protein [Lactococcus termiticola]GBG96423.1 alcohol dehydrogenase [Lactococcus termiticola]